MLSKILHSHIDEIDNLQDKVQEDIDNLFKDIDKKLLIKDPQAALDEVTKAVKELLIEKYISIAAKEGFALANSIKKRDVVVDPSKDPTENA